MTLPTVQVLPLLPILFISAEILINAVDGLHIRNPILLSDRANRASPFNFTDNQLPESIRGGKARLGGPGLSSRPFGHLSHSHHKKIGHTQWQCGSAKLDGIEVTERRGRILGGRTRFEPIPWQASLQSNENGNWRHICGAVLISQHHLLSASHCIGLESHTKYRVVLGKVNLNEVSDHEQIFYIRDADITTHRRFSFSTEFENDIAIIKVDGRSGRGVVFNDYVQPICLPDYDGWEHQMISNKENCLVSGWGSAKGPFAEDYSVSLQVASVPIQKQETCRKLYNHENNNDLTNWLRYSNPKPPEKKRRLGAGHFGGSQQRFLDSMLCAGPLTGRYVDSSRGDSGGGLACRMNGQYYLVGLVSWGDHFSAPGVYTRISHYLHWLNTEKLLLGPGFRK